MLPAATAAPGLEVGARPVSGEFEGTFIGPIGPNGNSIWFRVLSMQTGSTSMLTGIQGLVGFIPAACTKGKPGAGAIYFASTHPGPRWRGVVVGADGTFAVRWEHKADARYDASYVVSVRGTFERTRVSGRVQASGTELFSGKCRANRTFTARFVKR